MSKPSQEELTNFFSNSDIFKGIDVPAAVQEFYKKLYPEGHEMLYPNEKEFFTVVIDGRVNERYVVGTYTDVNTFNKLVEQLPGCNWYHASINRYKTEIDNGCKLFLVELVKDEPVIRSQAYDTFLEPKFYPYRKYIFGTFFGENEAAAIDAARKELEKRLEALSAGFFDKWQRNSTESSDDNEPEDIDPELLFDQNDFPGDEWKRLQDRDK